MWGNEDFIIVWNEKIKVSSFMKKLFLIEQSFCQCKRGTMYGCSFG